MKHIMDINGVGTATFCGAETDGPITMASAFRQTDNVCVQCITGAINAFVDLSSNQSIITVIPRCHGKSVSEQLYKGVCPHSGKQPSGLYNTYRRTSNQASLFSVLCYSESSDRWFHDDGSESEKSINVFVLSKI
jgi:hypothetical protein